MTDNEKIKELQVAVCTLNDKIEATHKMVHCLVKILNIMHPGLHLLEGIENEKSE